MVLRLQSSRLGASFAALRRFSSVLDRQISPMNDKVAGGHNLDNPDSALTAGALETVELEINGQRRRAIIDPRVTLLDLLRETLGLTGTKKGCDHGQCGACTVLLDGRRILSCLTLAVMKDGAELTTIEGLAKGEVL